MFCFRLSESTWLKKPNTRAINEYINSIDMLSFSDIPITDVDIALATTYKIDSSEYILYGTMNAGSSACVEPQELQITLVTLTWKS